MKKYKNILYLVDDYIYLYNKKIYKIKLNDKTLKNGKIANIDSFIEQYKELLSNYKINNSLFGDSITVIINSSYTKAEISLLKNVLENIGYKKIQTINEMKLYKLNNNKAYINYNNYYSIISYIDIYKQKNSYMIDTNLFSYNELIQWIEKKLNNKDIFIFGINKNIEQLTNDINNNNCYYYNNSETFLIDTLIN